MSENHEVETAPVDLRVRCEPPTIEEALEMTGATKCEFGAGEDECEACGEPNKQLYYIRTCCEVDEGEYYCEECTRGIPAAWGAMAKSYANIAEKDLNT